MTIDRLHMRNLLLVFVIAVTSGCGQSTSDVARAIRSTSPEQARRDRDALFGRASESRLRELSSHPHNTIALNAAWERARRRAVRHELADKPRPNAEAPQEFVKFVKARLGLVPRWWEETVVSAYTYPDIDHFFSKVPEYWPFSDTNAGPQVPRNTSLKKDDGEFLVTVDEDNVRVPADVLITEYTSSIEVKGISALITRDKYYLAVHFDFCLPYDLTCIDRTDGTIIWKTQVWAADYGRSTQGPAPYWHGVTLIEREGELLVFGLGLEGAYIEGFKIEDGTNTFRFCTAY